MIVNPHSLYNGIKKELQIHPIHEGLFFLHLQAATSIYLMKCGIECEVCPVALPLTTSLQPHLNTCLVSVLNKQRDFRAM